MRWMEGWRIDEFAASLTSLSANTVAGYTGDVRLFAAWCERSEILDPSRVDRSTIRRYLAFLTTRQFARRTVARKIASIRRYCRWSVVRGYTEADPTSGVSIPADDGRLPRVLDRRQLLGRSRPARPSDADGQPDACHARDGA